MNQLEGKEFTAVLNGFVREPWEMNGKTGTYLQLSVTPEGEMDSMRLTCTQEVQEAGFPPAGSVVRLTPVFNKEFGKSIWKCKIAAVHAAEKSKV